MPIVLLNYHTRSYPFHAILPQRLSSLSDCSLAINEFFVLFLLSILYSFCSRTTLIIVTHRSSVPDTFARSLQGMGKDTGYRCQATSHYLYRLGSLIPFSLFTLCSRWLGRQKCRFPRYLKIIRRIFMRHPNLPVRFLFFVLGVEASCKMNVSFASLTQLSCLPNEIPSFGPLYVLLMSSRRPAQNFATVVNRYSFTGFRQ